MNRTPIYITIEQRWELNEWVRRGRPAPPPHIVKQLTIREFAEKREVRVLIETGTYYGDMVEAMKDYFSRIYSIELSRELYEKAKQRFAGDDKVKIIHGDSGIELGKLIASLDQAAVFWLDGHYSEGVTARGDKDTPIYEELTHIFNSPQKGHVIIIDDARLFGTDPAYPSIDELSRFAKAKNPNVTIEVENDNIRIVPCSQVG
ncbi:MAG: hypothetical protein AYP45_12635 [Candidatus Brocadia carolinensis]|uniref:Methyltransferase domain-containing protein n=1 Tax=Candidatus Brocadia carolinensis TaxID=1004156 RepID=A0A1V4ARS0_9BACT|nr:MAG: hypothetical protein AYP45_12635 [Candidatus Brocadia caroliniensis]